MPEKSKIEVDLSLHGFPPGFKANFEVMESGEKRYRFLAPDGTVYIRTEAGPSGAWQNAHHHGGEKETYVVFNGWMGYVWLEQGRHEKTSFEPEEVETTKPGEDHNVYLPAGAVIGTVKYGTSVPNPEKSSGVDWYPADKKFDTWSKSLTEDDIKSW